MGNKLKEARAAQGVSMSALAVKARCSTSTIVSIERYAHVPSFEVRWRIARALGVLPSDIWQRAPSEHMAGLAAQR